MWMRKLGQTGIEISALGLGTVKLGRNTGVKYPESFTIPDTKSALALIDQAADLGINLIDTAPSYGNSEQQLGAILKNRRQRWVVCSKVGEEFDGYQSTYNFSPEHAQLSVERSLSRLNTDVIDIVLVHSDGNDLEIINNFGTLDALAELKRKGLIRAYGMSTKSVIGGIAAAKKSDVVMATYNLAHQNELPVLDYCLENNKGVLLKKVFASGHFPENEQNPLETSLKFAFDHDACSSGIVGTINPHHLKANVLVMKKILDEKINLRF